MANYVTFYGQLPLWSAQNERYPTMVYYRSMKLIRRLFMVLGVLFFIQLIGIGYVVIADPFNLRPLALMVWQASRVAAPAASTPVGSESDTAASDSAVSSATQSGTTAPSAQATASEATGINADQAKALQSVGLDASALAAITPAQEACFVGILGATRVAEIKAGAVPTASEFFSVRNCLST